MIALYILGGILLLLLLLGCVKISFFASFCDKKPFVLLKVGFLSFPIVDGSAPKADAPAPSKKKRKKQSGSKKDKPAKPEKPSKKPKTPPVKPTVSELIHLFLSLVKNVLRSLGLFGRIEELRLRVLVAADDAATTAVRYGQVCALISPVQAIADAVPKRKKNEKKLLVQAECDFLADEMELDARFGFSFRVFGILMIVLRAVKPTLAVVNALKRYKAASAAEKEAKKEG